MYVCVLCYVRPQRTLAIPVPILCYTCSCEYCEDVMSFFECTIILYYRNIYLYIPIHVVSR